jgi:CheY-like chemotaxis protein
MMNGWEFIEELVDQGNEIQFKPGAVVMYSTSNSRRDRELAKCNSMVTKYLVKGITTPESLRQTILLNRIAVAA